MCLRGTCTSHLTLCVWFYYGEGGFSSTSLDIMSKYVLVVHFCVAYPRKGITINYQAIILKSFEEEGGLAGMHFQNRIFRNVEQFAQNRSIAMLFMILYGFCKGVV